MYGIEFTRFKIRDLETSTTLFEIAKPPEEEEAGQRAGQETDPNAGRFVRYQFTPEVSSPGGNHIVQSIVQNIKRVIEWNSL